MSDQELRLPEPLLKAARNAATRIESSAHQASRSVAQSHWPAGQADDLRLMIENALRIELIRAAQALEDR